MKDVSLKFVFLYVIVSILIGLIFRFFTFYQILIIITIYCALFLISFLYVASKYLKRSRVRDYTEVIKPLAFTKPSEWIKAVEAYEKEMSTDNLRLPIHDSQLISEAFDKIITLIIRDFVMRWYKEIAPHGTFPIVVEKTIRYSLIQLGNRMKNIDIGDVIVRKIIPIITSHIAEFSVADAKVQHLGLKQNLTDLTELNLAVAKKYNNGKLHPAVTFFHSGSVIYQKDHLRKLVGRIIGFILPDSELNSKIVFTLVREIISCGVLSPIIELLIDPDILNQLIETISSSIIRERKKIKHIRDVLKKHSIYEKIEKQKYTPKFSLNDKMFERYIRFIKHCNNLSNLRRMRNALALENHKFQSNIKGALAKFQKSKYYLEKQIGMLTGNINSDYSGFVLQTPEVLFAQKDVKLIEILHNVSGLSYFMEFMDQKNRIVLVQFWLVVNGLNNPFDHDISSKNDPLGAISIFPENINVRLSYKEDVSTVFETYFSENLLNISEENKNIVKEFIELPDMPEKYHNAKIVLSKIQNEVFEIMQEKDLPGFIKSEIFLKYLTTITEETSKNFKDTSQNHIYDNTSTKTYMTPDFNSEYNSNSTLSIPSTQNSKKGTCTNNDIDFDILQEVETVLNDIIDSDDDNQRKCKTDTNTKNADLSGNSSKISLDCLKKSLTTESSDSNSFDNYLYSTDKKVRAPLFEESEQLDIDLSYDNQNIDDLTDADIHHASPGDLTLSEAIDNISLEIDSLISEESVLSSLIKKAELTNSVSELKIFKKSIKTIQSEIHRKKYQRQQYIIQENDNLLYGRSKISIPTVTIGLEMDGSEYTLYIIEIQKFDSSKVVTAGWILGRRYSEFFHLHQRLKAHFPKVRNIELPKKSVVLKMQKSFIEGRRVMLEKYLQTLLQIPEVCASKELRIFLSQQNSTLPSLQKDPDSTSYSDPREIIGYIFKYFSEGVDDLPLNSSFIDNFSETNLNILDAITIKENNKPPVNQQTQNLKVLENDATAFTKPVCDLFLEIFDLKKSNNWLKGRAIIIILQQLLGGAIERKLRETLRQAFEEQSILNILEVLRNTLWPNGVLIKNRPLRSYEEKIKTRLEAGFLFSAIFPSYLPDVAHKKLFNILQNSLLNSHLVFSIFDEIIEIIFPEIKETT
ncbi:uncharacterized protein T551_00337 [Pneumocystis jirovecii RU7]|uniref:PXA domain-containing protein n=1 Tax=Pneumocystis jirovecii (strain RU7) TaxID=1408657 RepID=A0A0W4ZV45_PNEJ7|nr:uncharacterized protein T551_00337 [Pneumocystis jirovecii RU7]KTW32246.1 hypothetical protein T551_00337 [Pneumocystis jirovecii RU7]